MRVIRSFSYSLLGYDFSYSEGVDKIDYERLKFDGRFENKEVKYADETISVGDYVLSGGEIPALLLIDAIARYKDTLNNKESVYNDTFEENSEGLLEYSQYTRPEKIDDMEVPNILMSGNHKNIEELEDWNGHGI